MKSRNTYLFTALVLLSCLLIAQAVPPKNAESRDGYRVGNYRVEIGGSEQAGILQIVELVPYRTALKATTDQTGLITQRVFTRYVTPPFKIIRIADYDDSSRMNQWVRDSIRARNAGQNPSAKAVSLDIIMLDGSEEKIKFRVKNAWIREVAYSDLDRSSGGRLKETLTIESESIDPRF